MVRHKKAKDKDASTAQDAQEAVHGTDEAAEGAEAGQEPESSENEPVETPAKKGRTADKSAWMYHKDHPPRLFKAGDEIPAGWQDHKSGQHRNWKQQEDGTFKKA